jgi:hypothetical protein
MGGAGVASLTNAPLEMARLLAVLERDPALRREMVSAQRARVEQLGQEAVAEAVREGLQPFLEGTTRAPASAPEAPAVHLVCPGFAAFPQAPASQLARRLAEQLPGARLLTLDPQPRPEELAPRSSRVEGLEVRAFTPDEPLSRDEAQELPGSSSLQTALRTSHGPTVFLPADSLLARDTLPHLSSAAWGVRTTSRSASAPDVAERLGQRLLTFDPARPEPTVSALVQALRATGALRAS